MDKKKTSTAKKTAAKAPAKAAPAKKPAVVACMTPAAPAAKATVAPAAKAPAAKKKAAPGVTLKLNAQPGLSVFVAGSFNNWDPKGVPLVEKRKGSYSATLDLAPGIYEYKFVIDGVWTLDPDPARDWTQNGLGTLNSLLRVE